MGYGMLGHVGISFQQSYGTAYTSSMDWIPAISESLTEEIPPISAEGMRGRFDEGDHYEGAHSIAGEIVMEVHPLLVGKFVRQLVGHTSGTLVGSVWTHLATPAQTDFDNKAAVVPATIEVHRDTGSSFLYSDCLLNTMSFEYANGVLNRCTAGFIGGNFAWAAKSAPSYPTGSYFPWDVTSISLGGSALDVFSQLTVTINNNFEARHTLNGTKYPSRIKRTGFRTVEIGGTAIFEDTTQASHFTGQSLQRLIVTATGESVTTSQNNVFKIDVPKMVYETFPVNMGGPGLIEVGFSGRGKYDTSSSYAVEFTTINTKASYYV